MVEVRHVVLGLESPYAPRSASKVSGLAQAVRNDGVHNLACYDAVSTSNTVAYHGKMTYCFVRTKGEGDVYGKRDRAVNRASALYNHV